LRAPENILSQHPPFFDLNRYSGVAIVYKVAKPVRIGSVIDNESSHGDSRVADIAVPSVSRSATVRRREINRRKTGEDEKRERKDKGIGISKAYKEVALVCRYLVMVCIIIGRIDRD